MTSIANDIEVKPIHSETDPEIARDVAKALKLHTLVPEGTVKTSVRDGYVTMEGTILVVGCKSASPAGSITLPNLPNVRCECVATSSKSAAITASAIGH